MKFEVFGDKCLRGYSATEIDSSRKEFNCRSLIMKPLQNLAKFGAVTYERVKGGLEEAFNQCEWDLLRESRGEFDG